VRSVQLRQHGINDTRHRVLGSCPLNVWEISLPNREPV
jgi:hypothetical protein